MVIALALVLLSRLAHAEDSSPFSYACREGIDWKGAPKSGFLTLKAPLADQGHSEIAFQFLDELARRIQRRIDESEKLAQNIQHCAGEEKPNQPCQELLRWVDVEVPHYVQEARFHLSLAQSPHDLKTWLGRARHDPNSELTTWALYKETPWDSLSEEERRNALNSLNSYQLKIHQGFLQQREKDQVKDEDWREFAHANLLQVRVEHFLRYQMLLGSVHLLQYLHSENPDRNEVLRAVAEMRRALGLEEERFRQLFARYKTGVLRGYVAAEGISFMHYRSLTEELLLEEPQYCRIAAGLQSHQDYREIRSALAVGLPILATSFLAPPLVAIAVGAGAGGYFAYQSQVDFREDANRNLGHIYGDPKGLDLAQTSALRRQRDFNVATLPLVFSGTGLLTSRLASASRWTLQIPIARFRQLAVR